MYLCQFQKGGVWSNSAKVGKFVKGHAWVIAGVMQSPRNSCDVSVKENQPIVHFLQVIWACSARSIVSVPYKDRIVNSYLRVSLLVCLSFSLYSSPAVCLSVCLSICLSAPSLCTQLSVRLSVCASICLSVCRSSFLYCPWLPNTGIGLTLPAQN